MGRWYHEIIELREILKAVLPEFCLAQVRATRQPVVHTIWEVVKYRSGGHLSDLKVETEADLIEHLDTRNWLAVLKKLWSLAFNDLGKKNPSALSYVAILLYTLNETTGHDRNRSSSYDNGASWETAYRFSDMTVNLLALIDTPSAQEMLPKAIDIRQKLMAARATDETLADEEAYSVPVPSLVSVNVNGAGVANGTGVANGAGIVNNTPNNMSASGFITTAPAVANGTATGVKPFLTLLVEEGEDAGDTQNEATIAQDIKKLCIEITSPQNQQSRYEITQPGKLTVGRSSRSQVKLDDPMVSRAHIELEFTEQGQLKLTPVSETNSTTLNGQRLAKHETVIWEVGQYVVIGSTRLDLSWG